MSDFYCIPTNIGLTKLAAFATGGSPITIVEFAVGDANGVPYLPETRVAHNTLVHECYRNAIESVLVSPFDAHVSIATINLAANVGGWRVCEIALIDDDGDIIYLANYPNNYKPTLSEGAGGELEIPVYLQASAVGSIAVVVDPNIIRASQDWVNLNFATKIALQEEVDNRIDAVQAEVDNRSNALIALMTRLTANGIDANLAETNNATGLNLDDAQFRVAGTWYFDHAINASMENTAGIVTVKQAGNKVYQHEILETGREGNRVFNGTTWLPWVFQTVGTPPPNTVPLVPISSYADLNTYITDGHYQFSTSDNIVHAPPSQGAESNFEMRVLVTANSGIVQIVKNITTNTGFVRVKVGDYWLETWKLTAPIEHIITNADLNGIRAEGVYLCTEDSNSHLPTTTTDNAIFIVHVKNSDSLQTVVQVAHEITLHQSNLSQALNYRSILDDGINTFPFSNWQTLQLTDSYYGVASNTVLRHVNLNNVIQQGCYTFTLSDNISNIPSVFTDGNFFFFLKVETYFEPVGGNTQSQEIYQYHYHINSSFPVISARYSRTQTIDDWANGVTPPDWTLLP
ncbi:MAG: phage tail protein [Moraxellaceae bacterium]|nr:phage tail protein [Moraxellaceae bacterium]